MDIRSYAQIAADQAYRTTGFNTYQGFKSVLDCYGVFYPDGGNQLYFVELVEACGVVLGNGYLSNTNYDDLTALKDRVSGLDTYTKKLQWYDDFKALNIFSSGNSIIAWVLWNFINDTLENPTTAPDAPLISL